jgi:hypothetical protein
METNPDDPQDPSVGMPDADRAPAEGENAGGPLGEITTQEDTSGGPLQSGAGEGAGFEGARRDAEAEAEAEAGS